MTLAALLILVVATVAFRPAVAQDGSSEIELAAQAGYDGYFKGDFWVPVHVRAANNGLAVQGYLQITLSDNASERIVYRSPISLPTASNKEQTMYVQLASLASQLTVELVDESDRVIHSVETSRMTGLAVDSLLYGVITREPGRLEYLEDVTGGRSEAAVAYLSLAELPDVAAALNALDLVVFHNVDTGQLTPAQRDALQSWLATGGVVVVTGGAAWQETTAGLSELLPVTISGTQALDDIPALRALGKLTFRDPGPYLVTESDLQSGETLLQQDGTPLLARLEHGRGSVFFMALDPSLAPLLDWDGSAALWSEIVGFAQPLPDWAKGVRQSFAASSAVSSLPASDLPPGWALFIFLAIYVIMVGPANYLVLRRLGRRELAWLTIPLLVLLFSATAYIVGFGLKGNETIVNQMSIIYGQVDGDQARVQTLIGLYSPRRAAYDLVLPDKALPRPFDRAAGTLSGGGNGGLVEQAEPMVVRDVRVDVGGVETLVADSYQPTPDLSGLVRLRPSAGGVSLDIEIYNNGPIAFDNASLLYGSSAIALGDLAPGSSIAHSEAAKSLSVAPSGGGPIGAFVPMPPAMSPLLANMDTILGSTNYYNDRAVYPRWQLLQAMAPDYGVSSLYATSNTFTLVAWSDQPQLDIRLQSENVGTMATSLYLLELPVSQELSAGTTLVVPPDMLNWRVLAEDGVYDARINDLYLPQGYVEFEFVPWPHFRSMTVQSMTLIIRPPTGYPTQRLPQIRLWDWAKDSWQSVANPGWDKIAIEDPAIYMGPGMAIRLQLSNPGPEGINIQSVYPELAGVTD